MSEKLSQLFKKISEIEPSARLEGLVLARIELEKSRKLRWKLMLLRAGIGASALAILGAVFAFGDMLVNSDFASMLALAFSDLTAVAQNWNDYALSLLETFPAMTVAAILLPVFLLFLSINAYINLNSKNIQIYLTDSKLFSIGSYRPQSYGDTRHNKNCSGK